MTSFPRYLAALMVAASPVLAQTSSQVDSASSGEERTHKTPFEFGVAGGALSYEGGRQEQAVGAVMRWGHA